MAFPSLGEISFTKFTSPEATVAKLKTIVPGATTAKDVEDALADSTLIQGSTPEPLWNDLLEYDPPLASHTVPAGSQTAVDNELLRAARADRDDRHLLLWVALNLADPRLDAVVREVLTDNEGRLKASAVNVAALTQALTSRHAAGSGLPPSRKAATNILSLLERCEIVEPTKRGQTIIGITTMLPTSHAVPGAVALIAERLAARGFAPAPGRELDLALSIGANAWLNLSVDEFRHAYISPRTAAQVQSTRKPAPALLRELEAQVRRKGQVVLQGPPGAGKTYVAKQYVHWVTAERPEQSRLQEIVDSLPVNERTVQGIAGEVIRLGLAGLWDIVQFHPGYDYTDFVRALVAEPHGEGVTFTPHHRILSLIAAVGVELSNRGYDLELVLILDEINRGDIPNIFGELLYALEYRGQAVSTPYPVGGSTSLTVPENLRLIGTMNTADRSIAVIDYALRRRFVFLEVASDEAPIRSFAFDDARTREAALYLFKLTADALSEAPSGLQVGPSYFLAAADTDDSLTVLAARFVYEVLPLLTEYEMEGEVDTGAIADLRQGLGLSEGSLQRDHAAELTKFLSGEPWTKAGSSGAITEATAAAGDLAQPVGNEATTTTEGDGAAAATPDEPAATADLAQPVSNEATTTQGDGAAAATPDEPAAQGDDPDAPITSPT